MSDSLERLRAEWAARDAAVDELLSKVRRWRTFLADRAPLLVVAAHLRELAEEDPHTAACHFVGRLADALDPPALPPKGCGSGQSPGARS